MKCLLGPLLGKVALMYSPRRKKRSRNKWASCAMGLHSLDIYMENPNSRRIRIPKGISLEYHGWRWNSSYYVVRGTESSIVKESNTKYSSTAVTICQKVEASTSALTDCSTRIRGTSTSPSSICALRRPLLFHSRFVFPCVSRRR